jgi:hypothetical protein
MTEEARASCTRRRQDSEQGCNRADAPHAGNITAPNRSRTRLARE